MKWPEPETTVIVLLIMAFIAFVLVILIGCTQATKAQNLHLVWSNGECILVADGLSFAQAKKITQDWTFEDCKVVIDSESTEEKK